MAEEKNGGAKSKALFVQPQGWMAPKGYHNGVILPAGRMLFIAGQIAWDENQKIVGPGDMAKQFEQAFLNVKEVIESAGGCVESVGKLTIYVTDKAAYSSSTKAIGKAYREIFGKHFPAMTLVEVKSLLEPEAMVEIEAFACLD